MWRGHGPFLAAGLIATVAQVLLLRELVVDVAGDETAIGSGLAAWLLGIALGARLGRAADPRSSARAAARGLAALAVLPPLAIVVGRLLRRALFPEAGELPGLGVTFALGLATLAPCGLAVGFSFTTLASSGAWRWRGGQALTRLYVAESLGSLLGGLVVTLAAGRIAPPRLAALVGLTGALMALLDANVEARTATAPLRAAPAAGPLVAPRPLVAALVATAALALAASPLDLLSERQRFLGTAPGVPLVASRDTPYQHLTLGGGESGLHLYASGQYVGSFPDPYTAESTGHLVALLAPRPERVLLLGGLERGLVSVLLRHPVRELVLLEPDRDALAQLLPRLPPSDRAALLDPRVTLVHDDPRAFLASDRAGRFDLVLALGPEPATLLRARLATVEFFRLVARRLRPDGVLVLALPAAPRVLTGETEALAASLVRSLAAALPVVHVTLPSEALAVAGTSAAAVTLDPVELARRWEARGIASDSFAAALLPILLPADAVQAHEAALAATAARAAPSRDDRPISFLHALARRQQVVSGAPASLVRRVTAAPSWLLVVLAFVPSLLVTLRLATPSRAAAPQACGPLGLAAAHAVATAGAAGLGWSLLVLFSFQTQSGALYGRLGALVALFMLGLALGAALLGRAAVRAASGPAASARRLGLCLGLAAAFGLALAAALAAVSWESTGPIVSLTLHGLLLLAAGAATGAVFPAAAELRMAQGEAVGQTAGRLETADHVGAAVAALLGAILFIPLLGLALSALLLAGLLALAGALVLVAQRAASRLSLS